MSPTLLTAAGVITGEVLHAPGWVRWDGTRIVAVGAGTPAREPDVALPGATVVPGFVDTHVHGGGGASFGTDPDDAIRVTHCHQRHGTTTMVASLVTAGVDELDRSVRCLAELVEDEALAGIHLEGPWLSSTHRGAHAEALLRPPAADDVRRLLDAGRGGVRMVTLAPELDGGIDAVRMLVDAGAVAAVGHTDATYATTREALDAGASVGTHIFNAMRPVHHREPGPALALLENGDTFVELIADGVHLHPAVVRAAATGSARPVLVTDAMAAAAQPDGDYRLGQLDVRVTGGEARLRGTGTIAGSTLTLGAAVRYAVEVAGLSLVEAVRAATHTPAALLGRTDIGQLAPGSRADLVALDADLRVTAVLRGGDWVVAPPPGCASAGGSAGAARVCR